MAANYGRTFLSKLGRDVQVIADGNYSRMNSVGITIAPSLIPTNGGGSAITLLDDTVVAVGASYMRFGQVLCKVTQAATVTLTVTGTPTGGSFTLTATNPLTGSTNTVTVPFNATVAQTQAQVDTLFGQTNGSSNVVVSGPGALPGNVQTLTQQLAMYGNAIPLATVVNTGLTGGSSPAAALARTGTGTPDGSLFGLYGPYDPSVADGRQTLVRGQCQVLNRTWVDAPALLGGSLGTVHPPVFDGGRVWRDRLVVTSGTHTLAAGPTFAEFEAAFPEISYVSNP